MCEFNGKIWGYCTTEEYKLCVFEVNEKVPKIIFAEDIRPRFSISSDFWRRNRIVTNEVYDVDTLFMLVEEAEKLICSQIAIVPNLKLVEGFDSLSHTASLFIKVLSPFFICVVAGREDPAYGLFCVQHIQMILQVSNNLGEEETEKGDVMGWYFEDKA